MPGSEATETLNRLLEVYGRLGQAEVTLRSTRTDIILIYDDVNEKMGVLTVSSPEYFQWRASRSDLKDLGVNVGKAAVDIKEMADVVGRLVDRVKIAEGLS